MKKSGHKIRRETKRSRDRYILENWEKIKEDKSTLKNIKMILVKK